ncbi:hypothetical protein CCACVL1_29503, partial [Corchorus capsularis]
NTFAEVEAGAGARSLRLSLGLDLVRQLSHGGKRCRDSNDSENDYLKSLVARNGGNPDLIF